MARIFLFIFVFITGIQQASAGDTTVSFTYKNFNAEVVIKYPQAKAKGTILLLHGYNLPPLQWCNKTSFCTEALQQGYVLIIPNFGRSTYQEKFYPQTNPVYRVYPTRKWIRDTVITGLQQNFNLLLPGQNNFVLGLSTGARGAALLALDLPLVFKATGCLSGDYDQTKLPLEKIYQHYYGLYSKYKTVWQTDDNIHAMISKWVTPVYLAHGELDKVCPANQTINFYNLLVKTNPGLNISYHIVKNQQHDYTFWGSQTKGVIAFFNAFIIP